MKRLALIVLLMFISQSVLALSVEVQALFKGMVVLSIDGERITLRDGQTSPEGVRLVNANTNSAKLEINGEVLEYTLGHSVGLSFKEKKTTSKEIFADGRGMFRTVGSINGYTVNFLVDTGATTIAMNANDAKRLGIRYRLIGTPTHANTASGVASAYHVVLDNVKVGNISQNNIDALIMDGSHPRSVLLGMSFLRNLKVEKEGNKITLEQR